VAENIHAGCVLVGEAGVLIRGPSGSGKSSFACQIITHAQALGIFSRIVSDDRTLVEAYSGRVVARPVPAITGYMELRGIGIVAVAHEPAAVVRLVVDLSVEEPQRHPDSAELFARVAGANIPRIRMGGDGRQSRIVISQLCRGGDKVVTL
jgi:serine kinase of HPr protein (carbohydrate metabolism regulator)